MMNHNSTARIITARRGGKFFKRIQNLDNIPCDSTVILPGRNYYTPTSHLTRSGCWAMNDFQDLEPLLWKGLLRS